MSTLPAFSNSKVPLTFSPFCSGCFNPMSITWNDPGLSSTVSPGLISRPPSTGRILATELALSDEGFEDISAPHRRKAARAIFLADEEHDALLVGQAAVDFGERQRRIAVPVRPAANAVDFDHREIFPPRELVDRAEAQAETAVMEFAHAACDGVEPRFELRRDMARRIVPVATRAKAQRKNPAAPR